MQTFSGYVSLPHRYNNMHTIKLHIMFTIKNYQRLKFKIVYRTITKQCCAFRWKWVGFHWLINSKIISAQTCICHMIFLLLILDKKESRNPVSQKKSSNFTDFVNSVIPSSAASCCKSLWLIQIAFQNSFTWLVDITF